jgi:hypothetical protein
MMGIWLVAGAISLASCASTPTQVAQNAGAAKVGSTATTPQPEQHFTSNAPVDTAQSTALTNFLHSHQFPLVGARVLASNGGPRQAILYGYVRTPFGKADAADHTRQWLNDSGAQVDNRITIEPDIGGTPVGNPNAATADNLDPNNPDIQRYQQQQQQELTQQQQQYMNQGSAFGGSGGGPLMLMLPFLLGGSLGGGGSSFGFSGGGFGSPYGSPYGSPSGSPYGSPYSSPYPPSSGYGPSYGP